MSEEELKAIEELKRFINKYEPFVFYSKQKGDTAEINPHIRMYENYKAILNLIEKQQKEIENSVSKDKIREKMQEYYEKASPYDCDTADYKQSQEIGGFNALRKLLEE